MNILELCLSSGFGGLELYFLKSVKKLSQTPNNLRVVVREKTFLDQKLAESGISRNYLNTILTSFPLISAFRLARYMTQHDVDVMHIHWGHDLFLAVLAKIFMRRKVKLIFTRQMALTRKKFDFYHRFLYKNVDAYVVITQALYRDAINYLPLTSDRLHLLYYGVPEPSEDLIDCEQYLVRNGIDPCAFKIAIFGRIEPGKGQHIVVEAVQLLIKEGKNIQAALVGHIMDQEHFNKLEIEMNSSELVEHIRYLGFHDNPVSIMSCYDVIVLASKCETFGLVLPEAMRAGTVVIGSNCGGVPEIISHGETGLLFESENPEDLANQLRKLIGDPLYCKKLANAGKIDADERFSEEKHFQRLLDILETA